MAYILGVNPAILGDTGMDKASVFLATALSAGVASIIMGLVANYPVSLAAGMGVNALFAYTICGQMGFSWAAALCAVFISGVIFVIISVTGIRKAIINAIPVQLKLAIGAGSGFFIAFVGLKNAGINVVIGTSCSLLHVPYTLENESRLSEDYTKHLSFAVEKLTELSQLKNLADNKNPESEKAYNDNIELLPEDKWLNSKSLVPAYISPDSSVHGIVTAKGEIIKLDCVFPVLHGKNGEDGTVQGLLQLAQIPYVGCDATSSGVCMDKAVANAVADAFGINQAKWCAFTQYDFNKNRQECIDTAVNKLGFPIFVKPANAGSSVGITKAHDIPELIEAMNVAFNEDKKAVLEEFIDGHEVECAVLGNEEPIAAEVGEIKAAAEFYDFDAKYNNPASELCIPADIDLEKRNEVKAQAVKAYKALGCEGMSRVDFFVRNSDGAVLLNEINTIPGQTPISMYPKLFEAAGVPYKELIDRLIGCALSRGGKF